MSVCGIGETTLVGLVCGIGEIGENLIDGNSVYHGRDYEPYAVTDSWEVMPGRPVTEWHGDECHDVGCPALEGGVS